MRVLTIEENTAENLVKIFELAKLPKTPPLGENYWLYKIQLTEDQALLAFPKFNTVGIGFLKEEDMYNMNLPFDELAEKIWEHIDFNRTKGIYKKTTIKAIKMLQEHIHKNMPSFKHHLDAFDIRQRVVDTMILLR